MEKRGFIFLLFFVLFSILLVNIISAQENDSVQDVDEENVVDETTEPSNEEEMDIKDEIINEITGEEFEDVELGISPGITPDNAFYFIDEFFDQFGDELKVREEKIAEIKVMAEKGRIEEAKKALENYKEAAKELEKEVDPEDKDEVLRGAAAITNAIEKIEESIPEDSQEIFVDDIVESEEKIVTAVEIASKIKELCRELSKLDPLEYSRVCKTEDAPKWQKKLDRELTDGQKAEIKVFGDVMSQCFRTQGRECRCDDIPIKSFADRCNVVAPLAVACDEGDENSCEAMDDTTEGIEDLLPDYLLDVFFDIERRYGEDQFDMHMPVECKEVGAKSPRECMRVMFQLHAPEECQEAFERGEIDFSSEKEARKACEEIMFRENAPEECVEQNIRDPKECGKLMFQLHAPEECIEAGLTGENKGDEKKCRLIMESKGRGPGGQGPPAFGIRCKNIENPEERLKCYDSYVGGIEQEYEQRGPSGGWPEQCEKAQAFTKETCEKVMRGWGEQQRREFEERREQFQESPEEFIPPEGLPSQCAEGQFLVCDNNGCRCESQVTEQPTQPEEQIQEQPTTEETTEPSSPETTTGAVIVGNEFLDYYFK